MTQDEKYLIEYYEGKLTSLNISLRDVEGVILNFENLIAKATVGDYNFNVKHWQLSASENRQKRELILLDINKVQKNIDAINK